MFSGAFSGFAVDDLAKAKAFYAGTLGLAIDDKPGMGMNITLPGGATHFIYPKEGHKAADFTVLNFVVPNIDEAVSDLKAKGVEFPQYPGGWQDESGIARGLSKGMGPDIAWFTDPAGNILSVLQPE